MEIRYESFLKAPNVKSSPAALTPMDLLKELKGFISQYKCENNIIVDAQGKSAIADYIIVSSLASHKQIYSMATKILRECKKINLKNCSASGLESCNWVIIDLVYVVWHLFLPEVREYYEFDSFLREHFKEPEDFDA